MNNKKMDEEKIWYRSIVEGLFEIWGAFFVTMFGLCLIVLVVLLLTWFFS